MTIQAEEIRQRANLLDIVSKDTSLKKVATTGSGEFAGPCPLCGGTDRFRLQLVAPPGKKPVGSRWMCRNCAPRWGDVIAYVQRKQKIDFQQALKHLAGVCNIPTQSEIKLEVEKRLPAEDQQKKFIALVDEWAAALWTPGGEKALAYLRGRGISDHILVSYAIGFNAEYQEGVSRGITIPCVDDAGFHYINVRRAAGKPKYKKASGSKAWPFGLRSFKASTFGTIEIAFLFESELDVLLAMSTGLDGVGYASIPAGNRLYDEYLPHFHNVNTILVAPDNDSDGLKHADRMCRIPGFYKAETTPTGKDITEYHQGGGDVLEYLLRQLENTRNDNNT